LADMGRTAAALTIALLLTAAVTNAPLRAQNGNPFQLGKHAYESSQFEAAFRILKPLAAAGNAEAQLLIGDMYNRGVGVRRDNSVAIEWYRKSAIQGNDEAIQMLGQGMRLLGESSN
jgi:TPR repeat protein